MEGSSKAEPVGSSQGELTREKLTQKCKSLLAIAQKAKISRDEALEEKGKLQKALEDTKSAMTAKDNQFKAVEEMLGVLTDQKLKLAMDIDTLKKEKAAFASQFKQLSDEKERFEAEALSMKRQYDRLLTENEDLIGELQLRERSEKQLLSDIKKLHENNESVKILCTNVTHEKLRLEEDLEKLSRETEALRQERNNWNLTLSKKYGFAKVDLESLVEFVDKKIKNSQAELTEKLEFENDESLAEVLDQLDKAKKENDLMEEEAKSMKEKIQRLMSELETANVDRDKMMANLEDVRIETKTLIENVDKLSEEVDSTKMEKLKSENALHKIIESKNGEIDALLQELSKNKAYVNELMASMNSRVAKGDKSAELPLKLKSIEEEIEPMKKREDEPLNDKSSKDTDRNSSRAVESSILKILKEGICSNLSDLKDTMPEYSKEFLDKLNSIIEGADCKGEIGADVFVHYFNECLSQLKISLKENEILTKELSHQKGSIKELEGLVEKHNTDCEQLRSEVEELSADSNRLLHDLGNLRQENLLRVSEIGELMVRLKQRNDDVDRLKEINNRLENEHNEQISSLRSEIAEANNRLSHLQEQKQELDKKLAATMSESEAVKNELESSLEDIKSLKAELENEKISNHEWTVKSDELLRENETLKEDIQQYTEDIANLNRRQEDLNAQLSQKSAELKNVLKRVEAMSAVEDELKQLKIASEEKHVRSLEAEKLQEENEALRTNLNELKASLISKQSELDQVHLDLRDANERLSAISSELEKSKLIISENEELKNERDQIGSQLAAKDKQLQSFEALLKKGAADADGLRATVDQLQTELKAKSIDLQKLNQELEAKSSLEDELKHLKTSLKEMHARSLEAEKLREETESLRTNLNELKAALISKQTELDQVHLDLRDANDRLSVISSELEKSRSIISENKELKNERDQIGSQLAAKDKQLQSFEALLKKGAADADGLKATVDQLQTELKAKSINLQKLNLELEAKSSLEDELKHLKTSLEEMHVRSLEAEKLQEENEALRTNLNELKAALIGKQTELDQVHLDLRDANDRLSVVSSELEKSKSIISENEELKNEIGSQLAAKHEQLQGLEALLKKGVTDADGLRATVDQLQTELKAKIIDLQKLNQELEAKSSLEDELSKLRDVLQKTVEDLDNSKKLAEQSQGRVQELEAALNSKHADVERMENETRQRGHVEVEFQKLEEELRSKLVQTEERLRLAVEENDSLKKKIVSAEEAFRGKIAELDIVQEQLRSKELIEEQLSAAEARLQNLTEVNERVALLEKESDGLKSKIVELEQQQQLELKEAELRKIETSEQQKVELLQESNKLVQTQLAERDSSIAELERRLVTAQDNLARVEATAKEEARKNEKSTAAIAEMSETVECLQSENDVLREKLKSQAALKEDELKARNADIEKLNAEMEGLKEMLNFKKLELDEINCVWAGRLNSLKVNLNSLGRSMRELGRLAVQLQETFLEKVLQLKNDFSFKTTTVLELSAADAKRELLDEMHRMNEVLKDRGNSISNLQDLLSEAVAKSSSYKSQIGEIQAERNKALADLKDKEDKLAAAESSVKELESELSRLKELKESAPENDSLSTSTISRTEEHMRFKEVDDSIEEKYVKLRQVAVKLKKKSSELTQTLEQERSKFTNDRAELVDKIQHLSTVAKNAQKVQESYDKALDELETLRKQSQTSSAAMKELTAKEESLKRRVATLESQNANIPLMAKQIDGLNHTIKDLKAEISRTEMEKKVEVMKYEEVKRQCTALESKSVSLTQSLDQAVQQGRATNVLELEINNYEKVISDLTTQLNAEKQKLANSEKEYASVSLVKNGLEEQIALLEEQVRAEESRNANLQEQMTSMRDKTTAAQQRADELNDQVAALRRDLQQAKNNNEQQAFEMSSLSSDFSRKEIDLQNRIDSFTAHIQSLETTLATIKQELATSNSEKEHLREEFECYRLRAQTMLARQKGDSVSHGEKEAREQLDKLKKELDSAREKMENNQTETETLNNKLSSLQLEKARSDKRYEDVTKALHQKITDYDSLNTEYRAFKFSAETLLQNTKVEFEERVRQLKAENSSLKELVETLSRKSELDSAGFDLAPGPDFKNNNSSERQFEAIQAQDGAAVHLLEREDGEGSESVPPPLSNYRRLSNLVPLDILLNNPIDDENRIPVLQEQIEKLHGELHSYEVRVKHLASLLSEAEKDAARSSQQNAVLKEELRRLERSLQREPNIANSEYLKNVIFKFLVLQSGDERTRLVPVLDTILKLSPDETSKLTAVAKGDSATWGSYLHSWTGL